MIGAPWAQMFGGDSIAAPLRHPTFRRIWLASVLSNFGILIQGVGAAWAMTQMASSADRVALVQTALSLPIMLIAMPAGAIADMYDRRIIALVALCIALSGVGWNEAEFAELIPYLTGKLQRTGRIKCLIALFLSKISMP